MKITRDWLGTQVEQGEPTDTGQWFVLDMEFLAEQGFRYLEVHYDDDSDDPNAVMLTKEDES